MAKATHVMSTSKCEPDEENKENTMTGNNSSAVFLKPWNQRFAQKFPLQIGNAERALNYYTRDEIALLISEHQECNKWTPPLFDGVRFKALVMSKMKPFYEMLDSPDRLGIAASQLLWPPRDHFAKFMLKPCKEQGKIDNRNIILNEQRAFVLKIEQDAFKGILMYCGVRLFMKKPYPNSEQDNHIEYLQEAIDAVNEHGLKGRLGILNAIRDYMGSGYVPYTTKIKHERAANVTANVRANVTAITSANMSAKPIRYRSLPSKLTTGNGRRSVVVRAHTRRRARYVPNKCWFTKVPSPPENPMFFKATTNMLGKFGKRQKPCEITIDEDDKNSKEPKRGRTSSESTTSSIEFLGMDSPLA